MIWNMLHTVFLQSALVFILLGCMLGLMLGIVMLVKPNRLRNFSAGANRWFSTAGLSAAVNRSHESGRLAKRYRRGFGGVIFACGLAALITLLWRQPMPDGLTSIGSLYWLAAATAALAAAIGLAFMLAPHCLDRFESWANRWHETEQVELIFDISRDFPDRFAAQNPRLVASIIVIASLYALSVIVPLLFE